MTIAKRLTLLLLIPLLCLVAVAAVSVVEATSLHAKTRRLAEKQVESLVAIGRISRAVNERRINLRNCIITQDAAECERARKLFGEGSDKVTAMFTDYQARLVSNEADERLLERVRSSVRTWDSVAAAILADLDAGQREGASRRLQAELVPLAEPMSHEMDEWTVVNEEVGHTLGVELVRDFQAMRRRSVLLALAGLLLAGALGAVVARSIVRPLRTLSRTVNTMAKGKLQEATPLTDKRDEIGELARSIEVLRVAAANAQQLHQQTQAQAKVLAGKEEALSRANFLADMALDLTKSGYWHVDYSDPDYYYQSERAARIVGEEIKPGGRYHLHDEWFSRLIEASPEHARLTTERYQGAIEGRYTSYDAVYPYKRPADGRIVWLHAAGTLVRDESGKARYMYGVYQDITAAKQLEDELRNAMVKAEEATVAKSAFLANMSHEIRTPMNGIMGMTELALDTNLTAEQRDYLNTVKSSADALLSILNDILDFSKIEAGRIELDPVEFLLRDSMGDTLSPLALRASAKGVELAYEIDPGMPDAMVGDVYRLRQVIVNLVGNAIKFTDKGEVVLAIRLLERVGDELTVQFSVRDTGIGIAPEAAARLFKAFEQAEASTTRKYGGTGLGLAISKQLVELMGGQIELESAPGKGSTFRFSVKLKAGLARTASADDAARVFAGKAVLIVDDNQTNRRIVEAMLSHWGLKSVQAESGPAALALLDRMASAGQPVSLIITDLHMPGMDGFELVQAIRSHPTLGALPVMLLTSSGSTGDNARCEQLGISARLLKPVKQSLLMDNLIRIFSGAERRGPSAPRLVQAQGGDAAPAKLRVLLAEDNPVNQKFAVRVLEGAGHSVKIANNGREALEHSGAERFDLILMDVQMPEMDGLDATRAIRARDAGGRRVPIIAMTANAMKGDREMCIEAGMDGYVPKPVKKDVLFEEVHRVLKEAGHGQDV